MDIGGNGLILASLANLIALRLVDSGNKYWKFHKYSLTYLLVTLSLYYLVLK